MTGPFHYVEPEGKVGSNYVTDPSQLEEFLVARVRHIVAGTF
jgi:hypothetical protein